MGILFLFGPNILLLLRLGPQRQIFDLLDFSAFD